MNVCSPAACQLAIQRYPSLEATSASTSDAFQGSEIQDGDFAESGALVVLASASKLKVLNAIVAKTESKDSVGSVVQTIQNPALGGQSACNFRSARFGRGDISRDKLFTVVNSLPDKKGKGKTRKRFVRMSVSLGLNADFLLLFGAALSPHGMQRIGNSSTRSGFLTVPPPS